MRPFLAFVLFAITATADSLERLVDAGRLDEAREQLSEIVASAGPSLRTRVAEAMILYKERRFVESLRILQELLGPEQRDARIYKLFGLNLAALGREADSEPFFRAAAQLTPGDTTAQYYLGMATLSLKKYKEAERLLREVIRREADDVAAYTMLGLALEQQQKEDAAIETYQTAVALARRSGQSPGQPELYLARYLFSLARFPEAAAVLNSLIAAVPDHAEGHRLLGRCLSELGELENALAHLRRATELAPSDRQARYAFARVLQRLGRQAEAKREFQMLRQDGSNGLPARP